MTKSWKRKQAPGTVERKQKEWLRRSLGEPYILRYRNKANGLGGYHWVDMSLWDGEERCIEQITDSQGYFLDFPGTVPGKWEQDLVGGLDEAVRFASWVSPFCGGISCFSWTAQPDGRYWADEDGFGMEPDEEVALHAYLDQKGKFVTPFSDAHAGRHREALPQFLDRINGFTWNSIPEWGKLWTAPGLKKKVDHQGEWKPFYGNTVVLPLKAEALAYVTKRQKELYTFGGDWLAAPLEPETFHMTLHDLVNGEDPKDTEQKMKQVRPAARFILQRLQEGNWPKIRMESTGVFQLAGTSIVLGLRPVSEEDCTNLMALYELFQTVVDLEYPLTPHITLAYLKPGKYSAEELQPLRHLMEHWNREEKLTFTWDASQLLYQEFEDMNHYHTR